MQNIIKDEMFIYFIADNKNVRSFNYRTKLFNIIFTNNRTRGIVRRIYKNSFCLWIDRFLHSLPVNFITRINKIDGNGFCTIDLYVGDITIITRIENNHFITRLKYGCQRRINSISTAGSNSDLCIGINFCLIQKFYFFNPASEDTGCNYSSSPRLPMPLILHSLENQDSPGRG
jgi:hypothetical protein